MLNKGSQKKGGCCPRKFLSCSIEKLAPEMCKIVSFITVFEACFMLVDVVISKTALKLHPKITLKIVSTLYPFTHNSKGNDLREFSFFLLRFKHSCVCEKLRYNPIFNKSIESHWGVKMCSFKLKLPLYFTTQIPPVHVFLLICVKGQNPSPKMLAFLVALTCQISQQ